MRLRTLVLRSLVHQRRTNAAVVAGVAVAVAVLAGALLVGRSVRASLRALAEERIGRTDAAVVGARLFDAALAERLAATGRATAPVLSLQGVVTEPSSGRRASPVEVWGVDERFWAFHGLAVPTLAGREALLSPALAEELGATEGLSLHLRAEGAHGIPGSTLFGRRDEPGRALRLKASGIREVLSLGEFSLRPSQGPSRALFVPLATLQDAFGRPGRVNLVLSRGGDLGALSADLERAVTLADLGLRLRALEAGRSWSLESEDALLADSVVEAAQAAAADAGLQASPSLIYLANELRVGDASVPYSVVAAVDESTWQGLGGSAQAGSFTPILLNDWTARELGARVGAELTLDYYVWHEEGRFETRRAPFRVTRIVAIAGAAADRELVPDYPGITREARLADWDPPFAVDLSRVRPQDEDYWRRYRTTPKAWLPLAAGRELWGHRLGRTTSLRLAPALSPPLADDPAAAFTRSLLERLDPAARGLAVDAVRTRALAAARGATDFGEYFVYFSFFLVVAALLLAGLFFRFGLEQRIGELGLLRAVGFTEARLRGVFLGEAAVLGGLGALLGMGGAIAYAWLMMLGLRTVWTGAVGTRALTLDVGPLELLTGAVGGIAAAVLAIASTLRGLRGRSVRSLLARAPQEWGPSRGTRRTGWAIRLAVLAALLLGAAGLELVGATAAFFGAGALLLAAALLVVSARLSGERQRAAAGATASVVALGFRQAAFRPGRSVLAVALVAFAAFVVASVGAFRHSGPPATGPRSETGGFALVARSVLPLHHDSGTPEGRAALGLDAPELAKARLARFRVKPGEDASCLNLYRPERPTLIAPTAGFLRQGRFSFQKSLAATAEEKANPWLLLERDAPDGAIPVIADAGALAYVLHRRLGETWTLGDTGVRVRVVGALRPGLLQSELVTGERHFQAAFPEAEGYRFFLIETEPGHELAVAEALEKHLADFGFDAETSASRLSAFHRVENTYIATFQTLGGLGLLLGTLGIGAVLVRNAFEQRRELALLRAVGYRSSHVRTMVLAETALLLLLGLGIGTGAALVAIAPALAERASLPSLVPVLALLLAVAAAGLVVSRLAATAVLRLPVLESLRSE